MAQTEITRQIFWGIPYVARVTFYIVAALSVSVFVYGFYQRYRIWRLGRGVESTGHLKHRLIFVLTQLLTQKSVLRRKSIGIPHTLVLVSFCLLFIGTVIITLEYDTPLHFFYGTFYLVYKCTLDVCGVLLLAGLLTAAFRRYVIRPTNLFKPEVESTVGSGYLLVALALIVATGYLLEASRLAATRPSWSSWSPVGSLFSRLFLASGAREETIRQEHLVVWAVHALFVFSFIASIPFTGFKHIFVAPLQMFFKSQRPKGELSTPFSLRALTEQTPESLEVGVGAAREFSWHQRLSFDACTSCGRCDDNCPAVAAGTSLSPKSLILKLRHQMENEVTDKRDLFADVVSEDEVMACRTCRACMEHCPVSIEHVDAILDMRRHLVDAASVNESSQKTLNNIATEYNPWGLPHPQRTAWMKQIPRPVADKMVSPSEAEVLYWVGCAASYDERASKVAVAFLSLLARAEVKFSILGSEEKCNGELARRIGEEGLFQKLAQDNIDTLNRHAIKKVLTTCPHCLNTLKNEYPKFGATITVQDHSSFLDELIRTGRLSASRKTHAKSTTKITYHDPCYLGRYNDVYESPRSVLANIDGLDVAEMERHRERSFCCGAGGANYWYEVNHKAKCENIRLAEARSTQADQMVVACPFCLTMFTEAARKADILEKFPIEDVAEILAKHLRE